MEERILNKYNEFLEHIPQDWQHLAGLAYTPRRYFYLADVQMRGFLTALENQFIEFHNPKPKDYSEQCYSYCYGFYALIRTCLEVSGKFTKKFQEVNFSQELENYRNLMSNKISEIVKVANDYVKHPVENQDKVTWYEPGGLDNSGEVSLYEWSTTNREHFKVLTIKPAEHIVIVYDHLEKLAELYIKQLGSNSSK